MTARPRRPKSCGPAKSGLPRSLPTGSVGLSGDDGDSLRAFAGESTKQAGAPPRAERRMQTA